MNRGFKTMVVVGVMATGVAFPTLAAPEATFAIETAGQADGSAAMQAQRETAERRALDLVSSLGADALRALQQRPEGRYSAMATIVEHYVDIGFVLRSSLPRDLLAALDDSERVAVARAYQSFATADYVRTFDSYNGETLDVVSVTTIGPGVVRIGTRLRSSEIEGGLSVDWIVAGLETRRAGLRDLIVEGASTLAGQQQLISALWGEVGRDKSEFLKRIASSNPWGDGE